MQDKARLADPPLETVKHVAEGLSSRLGLSLLGFDMVTNTKTGQHAIIDVNYFPGTILCHAEHGPLFADHGDGCVQDTLEHPTSQSCL